MFLGTMAYDLDKVRTVNSTASSFASKVPTITEPTGDAGTATGASVLTLRATPGEGPTSLLLIPYGLGSNNDAFSMRLIGWKPIRRGAADVLWIPVPLLELACVIGNITGVALSAVLATELFCDTLTGVANKFNANVTCAIASPQDDTIAHAIVDLRGFSRVEFTFDQTTNTPAMNCLWAQL